MKLVEFSANTPEEHIVLDELLLLKAGAGEVGETLRFWETKEHFVVLGRAGKVEEDCFLDKCRQDNIKILRRISGGGTVLQGPGCFNYSTILSYERDDNYRHVKSSYKKILGMISGSLKTKGFNTVFYPISDLALDGKKISGNAQARKRKYFLHHGTFLYDFDLDKISHYLKCPKKEPEYRKGRPHEDFLANIPMEKEELKEIIKEVFSCDKEAETRT
ncbi:MAG: biotin/lipoate A/B protein ligase family protein [Candidatus Omnitrophota bacterium]